MWVGSFLSFGKKISINNAFFEVRPSDAKLAAGVNFMWIAWLMVDRIAALAGGDSFAMSHSGGLKLKRVSVTGRWTATECDSARVAPLIFGLMIWLSAEHRQAPTRRHSSPREGQRAKASKDEDSDSKIYTGEPPNTPRLSLNRKPDRWTAMRRGTDGGFHALQAG